MTKVLVPFLTLICATALMSCASSMGVGEKTRAVATIQRPDLKNVDTVQWRQYYEDQFEVYGSEVIPPGDYFPEVAKQAYATEKELWQKRAEQRGQERLSKALTAGTAGALIYTVAAIGGALLLLLIL